MKRIALLGAGEIGMVVKKIAEEKGYKVLVREPKYDQLDGNPTEALHVCSPYKNAKFIDYVFSAVKKSRPKVVIIHSTLPPGVTEKVAKKIKIPVANSPVRGNHPDLSDSIKKDFVKYVGGVDKKSTRLAAKHLRKLGIRKVVEVKSALDAELGKMVNITAYAWSIIFCRWVKRMCDELGADFDAVYTDFTKTYNQGYKNSRPNVAQPILKPVKGPIGGHCVIPDTVLLDKVYKSAFTKFILKENESYKKER